jgi:hypothetical protein
MLKRLLLSVIVVGLAVVAIRSMPDLRRYLKIRGM